MFWWLVHEKKHMIWYLYIFMFHIGLHVEIAEFYNLYQGFHPTQQVRRFLGLRRLGSFHQPPGHLMGFDNTKHLRCT